MNPASYFREYRQQLGFSNQIEQNYFKWRLLDPVPELNELELILL